MTGGASPWRALEHPNFRLFFAGQLISQAGRWMQGVAQAWLVLDLTGSALALGTVTVIQHAPILPFSLLAGPVADRFRKRRFLMALQLAIGLQATVVAVLVITGHVQLWHVYVLAALYGIGNAIDNPTRQAFINELVGPSDIPSAVGLNSSLQNAARIVGPALGGLVIAAWGTGWCFALNAAAFVVSFGALAAINEDRLRPAAAAAAGRVHTQIIGGLRYVIGERDLLVPLALLGLIGTIGFNWSVTLPLLARYVFDIGATGFGVLNTAMGLGALTAGLIVASRPPPSARQLCGVGVVFGALLLILSVTPTYALALPMLAVAGCVSVLFSAGVNTTVQLLSRPEFRGRVLGVYFIVWAGGTPIGSTLTATVAEAWGIRSAVALNGTLCLMGAAVAVLYLLRSRERPLPSDPARVAPAIVETLQEEVAAPKG